MKKLLLLVTLLLSTGAAADELVINLASHHIDSVVDFNERNYGIGYRWADENIEVGFFRNSYAGMVAPDVNGLGYSLYAKGSAGNFQINKYIWINCDVGLAVYGADGPLPIMPIVQPMLILKPLKRINVNLGYMPMFYETVLYDVDGNELKKSTMKGVLTLSVGYLF